MSHIIVVLSLPLPLVAPTSHPTASPSSGPSANPTSEPSSQPTSEPSSQPTASPVTSQPTSHPTHSSDGCSPEYDSSYTEYEPGDEVSHEGLKYTCRVWPQGLRCNQPGFEPGTSLYWSEAWELVGPCSSADDIFT